jgi:biopolymer transport protein ExbB/TolQ
LAADGGTVMDNQMFIQILIALFSFVSTCLIGVGVWVWNRMIGRFDQFEESFGEAVRDLTRSQEHIRTLFKNDQRHDNAIKELQNRIILRKV